MAEAVQNKGRGMKFAEEHLKRHGWEHGKGLGRKEDGLSQSIKVKVKCDKGGVGHKEGEQFTFHWWDHIFNKASSSLQVESDQDGIALKKRSEDGEEEDGMISNKKPRKATLAKDKLYGCFVKSATLLSGQEQPEPRSSKSSDISSSSDEDDDQKLDLSSTTQLSDGELMKVCGGRTAHKGARHGLTMSAKLARLEQQEAEFMAKYGKKITSSQERPEDVAEETQNRRRKKKHSREKTEEINVLSVLEKPGVKVKTRKNRECEKKEVSCPKVKTRNNEECEKEMSCVENRDTKIKRKCKKRKNGEYKRSERSPEQQQKNNNKKQSEPAEEDEQLEDEEQPLKKKHRKSKKEKNMFGIKHQPGDASTK
ncbi:G patch domain-containing protein 4 [Nerophis ophidion]|uniref:G patch domain-containing protein 4 n=1 Tax=Nerophis ophidion TaxID=159077 RepID=UPI002AE08FD3|nr:G patch domain-containing protein 4 [Nerophis ophidion]XP_061771552.1 G patch domain-containing protein 4 [Nerophis ophidion]